MWSSFFSQMPKTRSSLISFQECSSRNASAERPTLTSDRTTAAERRQRTRARCCARQKQEKNGTPGRLSQRNNAHFQQNRWVPYLYIFDSARELRQTTPKLQSKTPGHIPSVLKCRL